MIKTAEPVLSDHQDWQLHRHGQIANKIVWANRYQPTACPFHDDMFNALLEGLKCSKDLLDIDQTLFPSDCLRSAQRAFLTKLD